ncbi:MAG TPA: protein translocase subunit SecF [bacterium]|jgi:preprotein translocase subunit SecF
MPHLFPKTNIKFIEARWVCITISIIIIVAGIVSMAIRGMNWSIDFTGGLDVQVRFDKPVSDGQVRDALTGAGVDEVKTISGLGAREEMSIRMKSSENSNQVVQQIRSKLEAAFPGNPVEVRNVQVVGPKVGRELRGQALLSAIVAMVLLLVYISWRFEFKFAVGGVVGLFHDTMLTLAFLSFFGYEFSLSVLAAILTLIGYSLNDTIVVYDRIRENLKKLRSVNLASIMDLSINETLSRTVITSFTVFLTVLVLFIWGGPVLRGFSFTMLIGVITGTYSSIYVSAPIVLEWAEKTAIKGKKR